MSGNCVYISGYCVSMFCHAFCALLCSIMFIGSNEQSLCNCFDVIRSIFVLPVMNRVALFCIVCSFLRLFFEATCKGMHG